MGGPAGGAAGIGRATVDFFEYLNFVLQFCPIIPDDKNARANFERIGIKPSKPFDPAAFSPEVRQAIVTGMAEGAKVIDTRPPPKPALRSCSAHASS